MIKRKERKKDPTEDHPSFRWSTTARVIGFDGEKVIWVLCEGVPFCVALDKIRPATPAETLAYINTRGPGVDPLSVDVTSSSSQQNIIDAVQLQEDNEPLPTLVEESDEEGEAVPAHVSGRRGRNQDDSSDDEPPMQRRRIVSTIIEPDGEATPPQRLIEPAVDDDQDITEEENRKRLQRACLEDLPGATHPGQSWRYCKR